MWLTVLTWLRRRCFLAGVRRRLQPSRRPRRPVHPLAVEALDHRVMLSALAGHEGLPVGRALESPASSLQFPRHRLTFPAGDAAATPDRIGSGNGGIRQAAPAVLSPSGPGYPLAPAADPAVRRAAVQTPAKALASPLNQSPLALVAVALPRAATLPADPAGGVTASVLPPAAEATSDGHPSGPAAAPDTPGLPLESGAPPATSRPSETVAQASPATQAVPVQRTEPGERSSPGTGAHALPREEAYPDVAYPSRDGRTSGPLPAGDPKGEGSASPHLNTDRRRTESLRLSETGAESVPVSATHVQAVARPTSQLVRDRMVASLLTAIVFATGAKDLIRRGEDDPGRKARGRAKA